MRCHSLSWRMGTCWPRARVVWVTWDEMICAAREEALVQECRLACQGSLGRACPRWHCWKWNGRGRGRRWEFRHPHPWRPATLDNSRVGRACRLVNSPPPRSSSDEVCFVGRVAASVLFPASLTLCKTCYSRRMPPYALTPCWRDSTAQRPFSAGTPSDATWGRRQTNSDPYTFADDRVQLHGQVRGDASRSLQQPSPTRDALARLMSASPSYHLARLAAPQGWRVATWATRAGTRQSDQTGSASAKSPTWCSSTLFYPRC